MIHNCNKNKSKKIEIKLKDFLNTINSIIEPINKKSCMLENLSNLFLTGSNIEIILMLFLQKFNKSFSNKLSTTFNLYIHIKHL